MLPRNILIAVGTLCTIAGLALSVVWLGQMRSATVQSVPPRDSPRTAVLVASRSIPAGTLLRPEDVAWKKVEAGEVRPGSLLHGQASEAEVLGAATRRDLAGGEQLAAAELVKPSDPRFLAAALKAGMRAVSIAVDAPQSAFGLVRPGNSVDVILVQSFSESGVDRARRTVGETVLRDVRVIALDQLLSVTGRIEPVTEPRAARTVTLEVTEREAESLLVAAQLGRLQLSIRPLRSVAAVPDKDKSGSIPTWASDVSPALKELTRKNPETLAPSTIENSVRRPPTSLRDVAR